MQNRGVEKIFSETDLIRWKAEYETLPKQIDGIKTETLNYKEKLAAIQQKLADITRQQDSFTAQLDQYAARNNVLILPVAMAPLQKQLISHQSDIDKLTTQSSALAELLTSSEYEVNTLQRYFSILSAKQARQCYFQEHQQVTQTHQSLYASLVDAKNQLNSVLLQITNLQNENRRYQAACCESDCDEEDACCDAEYDDCATLSYYVGTNNFAAHMQGLQHLAKQWQQTILELQDRIKSTSDKLDSITLQFTTLENRYNFFSATDREEANNYDLPVLEKELQQKNAKLIQLYNEKDKLAPAIATHQYAMAMIKDQLQALRKKLEYSKKTQGEFVVIEDKNILGERVSELNALLDSLKQNQSNLNKEKDQLQNLIETDEKFIGELEQRNRALRDKQFLYHYWQDPAKLYRNLLKLIHKEFAEYEELNPANQSFLVRSCLVNFASKLDFIDTIPLNITDTTNHPFFNKLHEEIRKRYHWLCGFISDLHARITNTDDHQFAAVLKRILHANPLDPVATQIKYQTLLHSHYDILHDWDEVELAYYEEQNYQAAYQRFNNSLANMPAEASKEIKTLYDKGSNVVNTIKALQADAGRNGRKFDKKFHTTVLTHVNSLLHKPEDEKSYQKCLSFVKHTTDGAESLSKKMAGALLMFCGAALIALGAATLLLSFGASTIVGISTGIPTFAGGLTLFAHGREKGTKRALHQFEQATQPFQSKNLNRV